MNIERQSVSKMSKKVVVSAIAILLVISITQGAFATSTIAVVPFDTATGISISTGSVFADSVAAMLSQSGSFEVMERTKLARILKEHSYNMSGIVDTQTAVEAGRLAGIRYLLFGSMGRLGNAITITARLVDIESGKVVISKVINLLDEGKLYQAAQELANSLVSALNGSEDVVSTIVPALKQRLRRLSRRIRDIMAQKLLINTSGMLISINSATKIADLRIRGPKPVPGQHLVVVARGYRGKEKKGELTVIECRGRSCRAKVVEGIFKIHPGDRIERGGQSVVGILFDPSTSHSIRRSFFRILSDTIDGADFRMSDNLENNGPHKINKDQLHKLAKNGIDLLLIVDPEGGPDVKSVNLRVFSTHSGIKLIDEEIEAIR